MTGKMPLLMLPEGSSATVEGINGGQGVTRRLTEMGFCKGEMVQIMKSSTGSLIVKVGEARYGLGRGMAGKIIVNPIGGNK